MIELVWFGGEWRVCADYEECVSMLFSCKEGVCSKVRCSLP
jgi:hypothetical protein